MQHIDGISGLAVIVIASFGVDRLVTGLMFVLSSVPAWRKRLPHPATVVDRAQRRRATREYRFVYFLIAGTIAGVFVAGFGGIRIFEALGLMQHPSYKQLTEGSNQAVAWFRLILDCVMTGVIMAGGAERVAKLLNMAWLQSPDDAEEQETTPIEVTGKLILEGTQSEDAAATHRETIPLEE